MKLLLFSLIISIGCHGCQSSFGAVLECPPGRPVLDGTINFTSVAKNYESHATCYTEYGTGNLGGGLKRCYQIFGLSTGGVEFDNARCSGGSLLSLPIQKTPNSRLGAFVRSKFATVNSWPTSFPGVWIDLKHSNEDCFRATHHMNRNNINQCFGRNFGHFAFDKNKIAGKGNCVHMIINRQKHWLGPRWKREDCARPMPFVCEVVPCPMGSFSCAKKGKLKCFKKDAVKCNGEADCDDRSDEENCPNRSCGATLTGKRGWLTSPNYPNKYDNDANCIWIIKVDLKEKIALMFDHIDTEAEYDRVTIIDGVSDDDVILKEISGNKIEKIPISSSNKVKILFTTDSLSQENGFKLTYEAVSTEVLKLTANAMLQHLTSPKFPAQYDANRDSDFLITARLGFVITLQFVDFHLGTGDKVIVRDGHYTSAPRIRTFSGAEFPHDVLVSYGNAMMVTFRADFDGEGRGFKASYIEGCRATIITGIAALESPGRSSMKKYPHNLKCSFDISPPSGEKLSVSFSHDFKTERDTDTVEVFCGGLAPSSLSGPLTSGKMIKDCSPTLKITFESDSSAHFRGWRAKVSHLSCPKQTKLPDHMQSRSTEEVGTIVTYIGTEEVGINTTVTYRCKEGFEVIGVNPQVCGLNGNWLSVVPNCQVKSCGKPKDIKNGSHRPHVHKHTYGGIEEYICNRGFHLANINDDGKRKCTMSGWEEPFPRCEEILCPDLNKMVTDPLKVLMPGRSYNSRAKYSCGKGFRLITHDEITICDDDGSWSGGIPDCEKIQCSTDYVNADFGEIQLSQKMVDIGSTITVKCDAGFEVVSGQGTATCKGNGEFDKKLKCQDIDECRSQNNPCNPGTCKNTFGGFNCLCPAGYIEFVNRTQQGCTDIDECQASQGSCSHICKNTVGSYRCECPSGFSDTEGSGQCKSAVNCPLLTAPKQGTIQYTVPPGMDQDKIGVNTTAELRCSKGYTATPTDKDKIPVCLSGGRWSNTLINCVVSVEVNITITMTSYYSASVFLGNTTNECLMSYFQQEFILSNKSAPTSCEGIGFDVHFFSKGGTEQIPMNSTVRITYKPSLTNERVKTCAQEVITLLQTYINNNISVNVSKSCPNFTIMIQKAEKTAVSYSKCYNHNAFHQNLSFVIDTTSTLAVPLGTILNCTLEYMKFKFASVSSLQCQGITISIRYNGFGSPGSLKASIVGSVGIFSRTSNIAMNSLKNCWQAIVNQTNELKDQSVSLSSCASSLRVKISNVTETDNFCDPGKDPWHNFGTCKQSACKNGAYCVEEANNSYSCICKFGSRFTGKHCDEPVTLCSRKPCKHNGTCQMNGSVEYNCSCPLVSGHQVYFGRNCEAVKPCEINPCKYGKCIVEGQGWKCNCSSGFHGRNCDQIIELCNTKNAHGNLPCEPHSSASCMTVFINNQPGFKCQCKEGWQGKHCEKDIDECLKKRNPCFNNATCINLHADFRCDCTPGWSGKLCGNLINSCTTPKPPCQNNGTCIRKKVGFECRCLAEWMGERCEKDVDECNSTLTCQNGGICKNTVGGYSCTCATGYEGEACVNMTNMCTSSLCKNGGICNTFLNGYNCTCPNEYEGNNCENVTDDCPPEGEKPCGVNGVCIDGWGTYSCKCNYEYAGSKCSKKKLPFDLVFGSFNSTSTASKAVSLSSTDSLSIEFWVRFGNVQGNETFMTITLEDQQSSSRRDVLVYYGGGITVTTFADNRLTVKDPVNSATWKYVVLMVGGGKVTLYQNGQKRLDESQSFFGMKLIGRLHVTLGTPLSARSRKGFAGEISRLNIYQRSLSLTEINNVVNNCNLHKRNGDILSWLMFDTNLTNVERIEPSICGTSKCKEGYKGADCSILIDVTPPEVLSCPDTIVKVNATHRLDHVTWPRPSFIDNVGIVRITMNHRIGEVFAYGEYAIIYVAYDGEGNSAICQFKVFVLAAHCPKPTPPYNGMVAYGTLPWVKFAQIACKNFLFSFASPPPPFYSCLADGSWFPTKAPNQPLVYPSCIENFPSFLRLIFGWLNIPIDDCSNNRKSALSNSLKSIINRLNANYQICEGACKADITVECGGVATSGRRKKRQTATDKIKALLTYDLPNIKFDRLVIGKDSNLLDELLKMIKDLLPKESGLKNVTVDAIDINTTPTCPPGSVLGLDNKCVNCTQGTFYKQMGKVHICVDCPQGSFQDKVAQTNCTTCGIGKTTMHEGTRNASQCFDQCLPGHYYNQEEKRCVKCSLGYYQDKIGTFSCLSCANGKTTKFTGAKSQNNCTASCGLGYEIETNGKCKACPLGTYRSQISQTACLQCPYSGSTINLTANVSSTSESQCTVAKCQAGHYRETDGCYPCQLGMYQPSMSTNASCIRCPTGMTTLTAKSTSKNDCKPGAVDECLFDTHDCHINATCSNTADSFVCYCKDDFEGNDRNCVSALKCTLECKNGGTCKTNLGAQVCDCPKDYSGNLCEVNPPVVSMTIIIICSAAGVGFILLIVVIGVCDYCCRKRRR